MGTTTGDGCRPTSRSAAATTAFRSLGEGRRLTPWRNVVAYPCRPLASGKRGRHDPPLRDEPVRSAPARPSGAPASPCPRGSRASHALRRRSSHRPSTSSTGGRTDPRPDHRHDPGLRSPVARAKRCLPPGLSCAGGQRFSAARRSQWAFGKALDENAGWSSFAGIQRFARRPRPTARVSGQPNCWTLRCPVIPPHRPPGRRGRRPAAH